MRPCPKKSIEVILMQNAKKLIPLPLRDQLRPTYQRLNRRWAESQWSTKPEVWRAVRDQVFRTTDVDSLLQIASAEFGITQVRSEITTLIEKLRKLDPRIVVEIGTHKGGNSFLFSHALPSVRRVVGVDLWVQNAPKLIFFARHGQIYRALHGDSRTANMRQLVEKQLKGQAVDFLFIDGDHSYNGVRADFQLYAPLVRPGGIVAFHDIVPDHRTRYGRETGCYAGEVYRLWSEIKQLYNYEELINDADQDGFGIGLIEVPACGIHLLGHG